MRFFGNLYVQVLIGIALGIAFGLADPADAARVKPLADAFINLIKMVIPVVIFVGVAGGIAHMGDMAKFGRVGVKTLIYFEVVSTFALALGLIIGELVQPGYGMNIDPAKLDPSSVSTYLDKAHHGEPIDQYLLHIIPNTFVSAFVDGNILQVLLIAVLTGFGCARLGEFGARVAHVLDDIGQVFFSIFNVIVRLAPIGAFGAMAFTVGKFGVPVLIKLAALVGTFYATSLAFVIIVLGAIGLVVGFSIFKFLRYISAELLIVLGTSSSESVLGRLMEKMQRLGASKSVTGLVIPTGYSFNLDGTNIYMTLATLFLAQATNTPITLQQELGLLGVAMLTSKGATGVTGAGFITLAATLTVVPTIAPVSIALIYGVDRFMSECRALTNLIGNGVATLAIARWEGELDREQMKRELDGGARTANAPVLANAEADSMAAIEKRLEELGITLPAAPRPVASYVPVVIASGLAHVAGQVSRNAEGGMLGKLGRELKTEDGQRAARLCGLYLIAQLKEALGDLDRVKRIVKINGFVNVTPDFGEIPQVMNGCSDLLVEVFGEAGRHARSAVGVANLPLNFAVEADGVFEVA